MKRIITALVAITVLLSMTVSISGFARYVNETEELVDAEAVQEISNPAIELLTYDSMNPAVEVNGFYYCDSASAKVEAIGTDRAVINASWYINSRTAEEWTFEGRFDPETKTLKYENATKKIVTSDLEDNTVFEETVYTDGSGELRFENGGFTWNDGKQNVAANMRFEVAPYAEKEALYL